MAESEEELNALSMKVKEKSEKAGLKISIPKTKIVTSLLIISWQIGGGNLKQCQISFSWTTKSMWM